MDGSGGRKGQRQEGKRTREERSADIKGRGKRKEKKKQS